MSRLITALIALPIIIASILLEPLALLFVAVALAAMLTGLHEFWLLARRRELKPELTVGTLAAAALFAAFYFNAPYRDPRLMLVVLCLFVIATLAGAMLRGAPFERLMTSTAVTVSGVMYVALLGGHLVALRTGFVQPLAADLLCFFFLVLMGADTAAYYTGRAFGRHKLAPSVSPGKTWEGAAGGMLASLAAAIIAHFWFFPELSLQAALPLAASMNVLGVVGDLTESALKRGAGAKDAANILPGHGGLLDRLDSLLFNAPVIYYFAVYYFGDVFIK
ncbi:MAG: phosphatidate cytidylyltransferase [Pyrinomonadaceae bacterium]|nr:phosphatidate cytidylyltransferase [Pyrinomonadaceae bacterium]MDQ3134694.1 phosphatidate cytidylyltransferase [Acidobacteriota bacterium]